MRDMLCGNPFRLKGVSLYLARILEPAVPGGNCECVTCCAGIHSA